MKRREFLGAAIAGTASVTLHPAVTRAQVGMRAKITDIKLARVKVVRELGVLDNTNFIPGMRPTYRVGGGTIVQVVTDQGLVGFGPGVEPPVLEQGKSGRQGPVRDRPPRHRSAQIRP
jgi:hypothetical protein